MVLTLLCAGLRMNKKRCSSSRRGRERCDNTRSRPSLVSERLLLHLNTSAHACASTRAQALLTFRKLQQYHHSGEARKRGALTHSLHLACRETAERAGEDDPTDIGNKKRLSCQPRRYFWLELSAPVLACLQWTERTPATCLRTATYVETAVAALLSQMRQPSRDVNGRTAAATAAASLLAHPRDHTEYGRAELCGRGCVKAVVVGKNCYCA